MATIASPAAVRISNDRAFYTGMGVAIAATVIWGFAPSFYFSRWMTAPPTTPEIGLLLRLHGSVFTAWIALMVVQPMLIAARNLELHRKLGYFGAGVAAAMIVLGNLAAVAAMHGGFRGLGDPYVFYAVPFFAINSFAVTVFLRGALAQFRRHPQKADPALQFGAARRRDRAHPAGDDPGRRALHLHLRAGPHHPRRHALRLGEPGAGAPRLDLWRRADGREPDTDDGGDGDPWWHRFAEGMAALWPA